MKDFFAGISSYGDALKLINRLGLWGYLLAPGLISILIGIVIVGASWGLSDDLGNAIISLLSFLEGKKWAESAARIFSALLIFSFGLILFKQLVLALASPIMSPLSEKIERHLAGDDYHEVRFSIPQILQDMLRGLTIALRNIIRELFFTLLLLILGFIPVIGLATPVLIFLVQAFYVGFGNIDYTLERHFSVRDSVRFARSNRWLAIGNGTVFLLLLFTGIGFLFALPLSTVAATVETTRRLRPQRH
ncbi:MAG: EI24 domain-containing protein [Saprospiraceae bacterium]|nr:EI24 domain-containing protein [Saprospiraceae bacterium]